jgi:hypothetical protein
VLGVTKMQHHLSTLEKQNEDTNRLLTSIEEELKKINQNKDSSKS